MKIDVISVGPLETNCYILSEESSSEAIVIDPGAEYKRIKRLLDSRGLKPAFVVNTHGHMDHIGADEDFKLPVYIHHEDASLLKDPLLNMSGVFGTAFTISCPIKDLRDNQEICLGDKIKLKVIHTPGHTRGSICLLLTRPKENVLFSGDTLFYEGVGRTDCMGGSSEQLVNSIKEKLFVLAEDTVVYPGHGPSTSIGNEKQAGIVGFYET